MPLIDPGPLESRRLLLRRVEAKDLADLGDVNGDEAVTRFLPYATWRTPDDGASWFDRMEAIQATGTALQLVVVERSSERAIGTCLVFRYDEGSARAELGYVLGRHHWRQGLMREAIEGLCAQVFASGIRRIEAEVNPLNAASCALLRQVGFVHEGTLRRRWVTKGSAHDTDIFGLLVDDRPGPAHAPRPTGV